MATYNTNSWSEGSKMQFRELKKMVDGGMDFVEAAKKSREMMEKNGWEMVKDKKGKRKWVKKTKAKVRLKP